MYAYYNEHDEFAAEWLRRLILFGHIAPGEVDTRSIEDVRPDDLRGFAQCHFFAGIGVWSYAFRLAGWPDDRPVWTGSCPCQPFSAAGKRGGTADERHLWPAFFHLIDFHRPPVVFGEQVASKDGLAWLDLVSADMEGAGYAFGAADLCAAGFGGAHIRQRLYFVGVADSGSARRERRRSGVESGREALTAVERPCDAHGLADDDDARLERWRQPECERGTERAARPGGVAGGVADGSRNGRREECSDLGGVASGDRAEGLAAGLGSSSSDQRPDAPHLGRSPADWLYCRDGKWRPVEPGTFPLAHAAPARVGRLRAYGNALDAETAIGFVESVMDALL